MMETVECITRWLKHIIKEDDNDVAGLIDRYLFGMTKLDNGIHNYAYMVYGYGDIRTNVQIQLTPDGPFLEVALYDEPEKLDPVAAFDRAMIGII